LQDRKKPSLETYCIRSSGFYNADVFYSALTFLGKYKAICYEWKKCPTIYIMFIDQGKYLYKMLTMQKCQQSKA